MSAQLTTPRWPVGKSRSANPDVSTHPGHRVAFNLADQLHAGLGRRAIERTQDAGVPQRHDRVSPLLRRDLNEVGDQLWVGQIERLDQHFLARFESCAVLN